MTIRFAGTDARAENATPDPARGIQVAASDVAACLWTHNYAGLCLDDLPRDMRTARALKIPIIVLRVAGSPPVPSGLFPPGTRVADVSAHDVAATAAVAKRLHDLGATAFPLLEPASSPEGTDA